MGVLDGFFGTSFDDPRTAAVLNAAAALSGSPRGSNPMTALAQALAGYQGTMSQAKDTALKRQLLQAQIDETMAQGDQRKAAANAVAAKAAEEQRINTLLQQATRGTSGPQALSMGAQQGSVGPTMQNAEMVGQRRPIDFQALIANRVPPELVKALAESADYGRQKVARTTDGKDEQGRPVTYQLDEFGQRVGAPIAQWKAPVMQDLGGRVQAIDPTAVQGGQQWSKTMTPGEAAANAVARGNLAVAQDRLRMDQNAPKGQYDAERGVMVDTRTGIATPVTQGGQPIGPKNKDLNDTQAKAKLFGERMQEANSILEKTAAKGVDRPGFIHQGAQAIPLIGGAAAQATNWTQSKEQQQVAQAQRDFINAVLRRESGAAIATSEFENAQQQYFPVIGDSAEVIAQKKRNREAATQLILAEVPGAHRGKAPSTPGLPDDINSILNRYNR